MHFPRVAQLKTPADVRNRLTELGVDLRLDDRVETGPSSPLGQPYRRSRGVIGNRFCILPMEGWDGTPDGRPTDLTRRRWRNFGLSGAKLIWGGEAVSVNPQGRDNPYQMVIDDDRVGDLSSLREVVLNAHRESFGKTDDLLIGLQLTHSGRFSKPSPRVLFRHPLLDERFGIRDDKMVLSDDEVSRLIDDFVRAAKLTQKAGYAFVDVKHCHGYLGHEFLAAVDRPGRYGGPFENRTRFFRDVVAGIRAEAPGLEIGTRFTMFDFVPYVKGHDLVGVPASLAKYPYGFGGDGSGLGIDLTEPLAFLDLCARLGVELICTSAGSPYYNPHIQRPAAFPPSDGYFPPEDPLVGVARQIDATARLKAAHPELTFVGSGYSYLQEWLPHVGQRAIRDGRVDFIGLGRMVLSYPELPADVLAGRPLDRKRICRTFSDCTTGPRNGLISGCFPLDPFYKSHPDHERLLQVKRRE